METQRQKYIDDIRLYHPFLGINKHGSDHVVEIFEMANLDFVKREWEAARRALVKQGFDPDALPANKRGK